MQGQDVAGGSRSILLSLASILIVTLLTLGLLEFVLRFADFRELRETSTASSLDYEYHSGCGNLPGRFTTCFDRGDRRSLKGVSL